MKSEMISVDEHEVVVDRDFIEKVGFLLAEYASTDEEKWYANECITLGQIPYDEDDEGEE